MLKAVYDSKDDIPEDFVELFTERDEKWELTEVSGIKTDADVGRLETTLGKERRDHKKINRELKEELTGYKALGDLEDITEKIDGIPELQARAKDGKLDEKELEAMVKVRVDREMAPVKRDLATATTDLATATTKNADYETKDKSRTIRDQIRTAALAMKVRDTALDDILIIGESMFQIDDGGAVRTKSGLAVAEALDPKAWLTEMVEVRTHWLPDSEGGGAGGGKKGAGGKNPWSEGNWDVALQAAMVKTKGLAYAQKQAAAVGSRVGATRPTVAAK